MTTLDHMQLSEEIKISADELHIVKVCLSWQQLGLSKTGSLCLVIYQFSPCFLFPRNENLRERERERDSRAYSQDTGLPIHTVG